MHIMTKFRLMVVVILIVLAVSASSGQSMVVMPLVESTVAGMEAGGNIAFLSRKGWLNGAFYQIAVHKPTSDTDHRTKLYGIISSLPVVRSSTIKFAINTRIGISNDRFLVIIPGVDTRIAVNRKMDFVIGSSLRYSHPSFNGAVSFKL